MLIPWLYRITLSTLLIISCSLAFSDELPKTINVQSEAWTDATNEDGSGYYWDILRAVFEPLGSTLSLNTTSYKRSVGLVQEGGADIMVGAYLDEVPNVIYPESHFDADVVVALYKKGVVTNWQGESSLKGRHVAWVRGYELINYIAHNYLSHEYYERDDIFRLLDSGELEIFLDAEYDIRKEMKKRSIDESKYEINKVKQLNLYFVFADNERGRLLQQTFDRQFEKMLQKGELKKLNEKWGWNVYPF